MKTKHPAFDPLNSTRTWTKNRKAQTDEVCHRNSSENVIENGKKARESWKNLMGGTGLAKIPPPKA
jgi:hypothetical protein